MAQHRSVGPLFSLAGGQTAFWSISYGTGQDVGIVTAAPRTRVLAQPVIPTISTRLRSTIRALRMLLII